MHNDVPDRIVHDTGVAGLIAHDVFGAMMQEAQGVSAGVSQLPESSISRLKTHSVQRTAARCHQWPGVQLGSQLTSKTYKALPALQEMARI